MGHVAALYRCPGLYAAGTFTESITAPVIEWDDDTINPPQMGITLAGPPNPVLVGDTLRIETSYEADFDPLIDTEDGVLTSDVLLLLEDDLEAALTELFPDYMSTVFTNGNTLYTRIRVVRGGLLSNWSNEINATVVGAAITYITGAEDSADGSGGATTRTPAAVNFNGERKFVCVLANAIAVTGITSTSGATFTAVANISNITQLWEAPATAAGNETVTVTFGSDPDQVGIDFLSGADLAVASKTDTATQTHANTADPKDFSNTLVVPTDGIGLCCCFLAGSAAGIVTSTGTILHNRDRGGAASWMSFFTVGPGTSTPSYTTGSTIFVNGVAGAWDPA